MKASIPLAWGKSFQMVLIIFKIVENYLFSIKQILYVFYGDNNDLVFNEDVREGMLWEVLVWCWSWGTWLAWRMEYWTWSLDLRFKKD